MVIFHKKDENFLGMAVVMIKRTWIDIKPLL
jgi:hypothetical protein